MDISANQFDCVGKVVEKDVLRFTPAGIPIVTGKICHSSEQVEAGIARTVDFEIFAIAAGDIAGRFNEASLELPYRFTGFLARRTRNGKSLALHLLQIEAT